MKLYYAAISACYIAYIKCYMSTVLKFMYGFKHLEDERRGWDEMIGELRIPAEKRRWLCRIYFIYKLKEHSYIYLISRTSQIRKKRPLNEPRSKN